MSYADYEHYGGIYSTFILGEAKCLYYFMQIFRWIWGKLCKGFRDFSYNTTQNFINYDFLQVF